MSALWREMRLYYAEVLIGWALRLLPRGPERTEFAKFIMSCWIGRMAWPWERQS